MESGGSGNLWSGTTQALEESFQSASNYSVFSGTTQNGQEGGWYGFKHTANKAAYGIFFSGTSNTGIYALKRITDGSWTAKILSRM